MARLHASLARCLFAAVVVVISCATLASSPARGDAAAPTGTPLTDHAGVRGACAEAEGDGPRHLYSVVVPAREWRFSPYDAEQGFLPVDTRRNLRALRGSVELIASRLEPVGFAATEERASSLATAAREGQLSLRVGFFLGFDNRSRTLCVVRASVGVTTARIDLAYLELVDGAGQVLVREETERFRAYADDAERAVVPGQGPRAAIHDARVLRGPALTAPQRRALTDAQANLRAAIGRCYADALGRGAPREAQTVVRLTIDTGAGTVQHAEPELSTLGDAEANVCVGDAFRTTVRLPPGAPGGALLLEVPVRFVAD